MPSSSEQMNDNWINPTLTIGGLAVTLIFDLSPCYLLFVLTGLMLYQMIRNRSALFGNTQKLPANFTTLARLILVLILLGIYSQLDRGILTVLYLLAAASDGLDGYLARRYNAESSAGADYDVQVDAVYLISLSVVLMEYHVFDAWILIPVFLRECWLLIKQFLITDTPQVKFGFAKWVAGLSFGLLPICFMLPAIYAHAIGISIVSAFACSFALEVYHVMNKQTAQTDP